MEEQHAPPEETERDELALVLLTRMAQVDSAFAVCRSWAAIKVDEAAAEFIMCYMGCVPEGTDLQPPYPHDVTVGILQFLVKTGATGATKLQCALAGHGPPLAFSEHESQAYRFLAKVVKSLARNPCHCDQFADV